MLIRQRVAGGRRGIPVPLPIFPPAKGGVEHARDGAEADEGDADGVALFVVGLVGLEEAVGGDDAANVAKACPLGMYQYACQCPKTSKESHQHTNLPRRPDRLAVLTAQVHGEPADDDGHGRVGADGDEKEGGVLHVDAVAHVHEHAEAGDGDEDGQQRKQQPVLGPVRRRRHHHGQPKGGDPRRHRPQLRLDGAVPVRDDDGGREVGVAVGRHDQAQVHEPPQPDLGVRQHRPHVGKRHLPVGRRAGAVALVRLQPRLDVGALVWGQEFLGLVAWVSSASTLRSPIPSLTNKHTKPSTGGGDNSQPPPATPER